MTDDTGAGAMLRQHDVLGKLVGLVEAPSYSASTERGKVLLRVLHAMTGVDTQFRRHAEPTLLRSLVDMLLPADATGGQSTPQAPVSSVTQPSAAARGRIGRNRRKKAALPAAAPTIPSARCSPSRRAKQLGLPWTVDCPCDQSLALDLIASACELPATSSTTGTTGDEVRSAEMAQRVKQWLPAHTPMVWSCVAQCIADGEATLTRTRDMGHMSQSQPLDCGALLRTHVALRLLESATFLNDTNRAMVAKVTSRAGEPIPSLLLRLAVRARMAGWDAHDPATASPFSAALPWSELSMQALRVLVNVTNRMPTAAAALAKTSWGSDHETLQVELSRRVSPFQWTDSGAEKPEKDDEDEEAEDIVELDASSESFDGIRAMCWLVMDACHRPPVLFSALSRLAQRDPWEDNAAAFDAFLLPVALLTNVLETVGAARAEMSRLAVPGWYLAERKRPSGAQRRSIRVNGQSKSDGWLPVLLVFAAWVAASRRDLEGATSGEGGEESSSAPPSVTAPRRQQQRTGERQKRGDTETVVVAGYLSTLLACACREDGDAEECVRRGLPCKAHEKAVGLGGLQPLIDALDAFVELQSAMGVMTEETRAEIGQCRETLVQRKSGRGERTPISPADRSDLQALLQSPPWSAVSSNAPSSAPRSTPRRSESSCAVGMTRSSPQGMTQSSPPRKSRRKVSQSSPSNAAAQTDKMASPKHVSAANKPLQQRAEAPLRESKPVKKTVRKTGAHRSRRKRNARLAKEEHTAGSCSSEDRSVSPASPQPSQPAEPRSPLLRKLRTREKGNEEANQPPAKRRRIGRNNALRALQDDSYV